MSITGNKELFTLDEVSELSSTKGEKLNKIVQEIIADDFLSKAIFCQEVPQMLTGVWESLSPEKVITQINEKMITEQLMKEKGNNEHESWEKAGKILSQQNKIALSLADVLSIVKGNRETYYMVEDRFRG